MASTSEVGHAKNVANLQKLIEQVTVFTNYDPSIDQLKIANLQTLYEAAEAELGKLGDKKNINKDAIYARQQAFEHIKKNSTRIMNQLDILNLPEGKMNQAISVNRIIQGTKLKKDPPATPPAPDAKENSTSRQSYTELAENFGTLVQILEALPNYKPNEEDLKIANLTIFHKALEDTTKAVDQTEAALNNQFISRNKLFYTEETGLYSIAQDVKKYVKSVYGATSPEFKTVSDIKFTPLKP